MNLPDDYYRGKIAALEYLAFIAHYQLILSRMDEEEIKDRFARYMEEDEDQEDFGKGWDSVLRLIAERALERKTQEVSTP